MSEIVYELYYKEAFTDGVTRINRAGEDGFHELFPDNVHPINLKILSEPPGKQSKSGYHLVSKRIDLPKPSEPAEIAPGPMLPRTLLEIGTHPLSLDTERYGRAVGRLLAAGYADWPQCQRLLTHLASLDRAFDTFRRELQKIPVGMLRQASEEEDE